MTDWDVGDLEVEQRGKLVAVRRVTEIRDDPDYGTSPLVLYDDVGILSPGEARGMAKDLLDAADDVQGASSAGLLTVPDGDPELPVAVERRHDGKREVAIPDGDGVLRDPDGRSYSAGAWSVVDWNERGEPNRG